ncbi:hypothetical protein [Blastococcus sp. TF02A-26]|uniref:hypothetical protein n=1 Tax=Blastococcus sp. TF02A-26 TaxID=2250577 RepID=UPI000DEBD6E6|nr:hypothetical protein [Blastococcus sp. TF02A-26]RBY83349.1 hypothetical protein DQ240_16810 [Blastococcus sp. TF02A-26]
MSDRESGSIEDDGPASPPIPSFDSLRAPQRRSALDLFVPPAPPAPPAEEIPRPVAAAPAGPRPAEWGDLVLLGTHLTRCVTRGLRSLLRG